MSILETSSIDTGRAAPGMVISCPMLSLAKCCLIHDLFIPFALQPILTMHVTLITMHVTAITCTVLILGIHGLNPAYGPTNLYGITRSSQSQHILQVKPLIFHIFWTPDACVCVCQKVKRVKSFSRVCIGILTEAEAVLKMSMVVKVRKQLNLLVWCRRNSVHSVVSTTLWCARYATAKHGTVKCRHGSLSWPRLNGEL